MINDFKKYFIIKNALLILAHSRDNVEQFTMKNGWSRLHPLAVIEEDSNEKSFEGFHIGEERAAAAELL